MSKNLETLLKTLLVAALIALASYEQGKTNMFSDILAACEASEEVKHVTDDGTMFLRCQSVEKSLEWVEK